MLAVGIGMGIAGVKRPADGEHSPLRRGILRPGRMVREQLDGERRWHGARRHAIKCG